MKKKFKIIVEKKHQYNLTESISQGVKLTLKDTENNKLMSITNTGDGIILDKKTGYLDYSEVCYLRFLLNYDQKTDINPHNKKKWTIHENSKKIFKI